MTATDCPGEMSILSSMGAHAAARRSADQPTGFFLAGEKDVVIAGATKEQLDERIGDVAQRLRGVHLLSGAGHWVQQERADEVNAPGRLPSLSRVASRKSDGGTVGG